MTFRLFYFVADTYPSWRFDVNELFGKELPKKEVSVTWSMRRNDAGFCTTTKQDGQTVHLPASLGRKSAIARIANRLLEALCEIYWFCLLVISRRYDVIQVRDDRYLAGFWAWLAARLTGAKFVYWLSFPFPENDAEKSKHARGLKRWFLASRACITGWWLYRVLLRLADHVFVQSEEMQRDVAAHGVRWDRMTPVPMAIPARLLEGALSPEANVIPGSIAYVGTLAAVRRIEVIIDAFAIVRQRCPEARLIIIGDGDVPAERAALERRVSQLGLDQHVRFTGFLPVAAVWELLGATALGISPFYADRVLKVASPTKLVEYMALSKPVVCNDHPEQSKIIRESRAGLSVPWGDQQFADAIIWMLKNPEEAKAMGQRGPAWVRDNRTYPIIAASVLAQYQRILRMAA